MIASIKLPNTSVHSTPFRGRSCRPPHGEPSHAEPGDFAASHADVLLALSRPILRWNISYDGAEVREAENLSRTGEAVLLRLFSESGGGLWHKPSPVVAEAAVSGGEEVRQREVSISPVTARETAEMRVCFGALSW